MPDPDHLVQFRRRPPAVSPDSLRRFAGRLRREVARGRVFSCLITGDREMRALNQRFLGRPYPTDVLSLPAAGPRGFLGDMAISLARARRQAREQGHTIEEEIRILMLHGLLHLVGMDHADDGGRMGRAETRWRKRLGLPAGLIERARS